VGYLSGEVVSTYLLGGAIAVTGKVIESAARGGVQAMRLAARLAPALEAPLRETAALGTRAVVRGAEAMEKLAQSRAVTELKRQRAAPPPAVQKATQVLRIGSTPVREYLELLKRAGHLGYEHGQAASAAAKKLIH
jgi:hypothetical protein